MLLPAAWASRKHSKGLGVKVGDFFFTLQFCLLAWYCSVGCLRVGVVWNCSELVIVRY